MMTTSLSNSKEPQSNCLMNQQRNLKGAKQRKKFNLCMLRGKVRLLRNLQLITLKLLLKLRKHPKLLRKKCQLTNWLNQQNQKSKKNPNPNQHQLLPLNDLTKDSHLNANCLKRIYLVLSLEIRA